MGMVVSPHRFTIETDPYYSYVTVLLHGDGANNSTTFTDQKSHTFTAVGQAVISTNQSKFGGASMYFDGTGDYIYSADNADFQFGSGDFTVEAWVRPEGYASNEGSTYKSCIVGKDGSANREWFLQLDGTSSSWTGVSFVGFDTNSTFQLVSGTGTITNGTWYHIAVSRVGSTVKVFLDGVAIGTETSWTTAMRDSTRDLTVGAQLFDGTYFRHLNGYIDDLRITKGIGRYSSNFTPPTAAFPNS